MLTLIIAALMALGVITSPADFHNASSSDQQMMTEIVIDDLETM